MTINFTYEPEKMDWTVAYTTDILKTWNGKEFRSSVVRDARETYDLLYMLTQDQLTTLRSQLYFTPSENYRLPVRPEGIPTKTTIVTTSTTADTTYSDWIIAGQAVWVENQLGQGYATSIASAPGHPGTTITITFNDAKPGGQTYAAEVTYIYPLDSTFFEDASSVGRWQPSQGQFSIRAKTPTPRATWGTGGTVTTFNSLSVMDRRPSQEEGSLQQEQNISRIHMYDEGGARGLAWSQTFSDIRREHAWAVRGAAERQWWKKFLHTVKGRWKPFLLPTWRDDFYVHTQPAPAATVLQVLRVPDQVNWLNNLAATGHANLQLLLTTGAVEYVTIVSLSVGGDYYALNLAAPLSGTTIRRVSWMEQVRFDTDEFNWRWDTPADVAHLVLPVLTIQQ